MAEEHYAYLLVEDEKWWQRRCDQSLKGWGTQAFVRRGKVGPKIAKTLFFYVKLPVGEVRGHGDFVERISGTADELWNKFGSETVFGSQDEYSKFIGERNSVTFIRLRNLQVLEKPTDWKTLSVMMGVKKMPNGGKYLSREIVNSIIKRGF